MAALVLQRRGCRSAAEYSFRQDQTDDIVRVAAFHRKDFALSVIWFSPREHAGIRPSIATPFPRTPVTELSLLGQLPLELLHEILLCLDMQSVYNFRQANLRSRQTVDSFHQYQMVVSHGLNLFCALLRTRLAPDISLSDFYHALCTKACSICGGFGGFVSLLAWKRCCAACVREALETQVQPIAAIQKECHLTEAELGQLKSFKTLPGIYTMDESVHKSRIEVASSHQAALVSGPTKAALVQLVMWGLGPKFNYMGSCALPYYDRLTDAVEYGMSCAGCFSAVPKARVGERLETDARDRVYARDSFLDHFRWCKAAQRLWESSDEGKREITALPDTIRRGGYFNKRE
jgi:hypothetical protein